MHAVNIVWLLSCHARAWVGITQSLPDIDRQFSLCFPLMQVMKELYDETDPTPGDNLAAGDREKRRLGNDAALSLLTGTQTNH